MSYFPCVEQTLIRFFFQANEIILSFSHRCQHIWNITMIFCSCSSSTLKSRHINMLEKIIELAMAL